MPENTIVVIDWKTIVSGVALLIVYFGGIILAVRHTASVMLKSMENESKHIGQRIDALERDIHATVAEMNTVNYNFKLHLIQMHQSDVSEQSGWQVFLYPQ